MIKFIKGKLPCSIRILVIVLSITCLLLPFSQPVSADSPPDLIVSGSATYVPMGSSVLIAPALTLTGSDIGNAKVAISTNFAAGDYLGMQPTGAATSGTLNGIAWSYNAATGIMNLQNSTTTAIYQSVLRQVTFYSTSGTPATAARTISLSVGSGLYCAATGHFYQYVTSAGIHWDAAKTAAENMSYFGLQGYLATVTSAAENTFIKSKLSGSGWMGANDAVVKSDWYWVTGPEGAANGGTGTYFFKQTGAHVTSVDLNSVYGGNLAPAHGFDGNAINGAYVNWADGEPNDWGASGEYYAHFLGDGTGTWNDYAINNAGIQGYVVEFGGMVGDLTPNLNGAVTLNIATPGISATGNTVTIVNGDSSPSVVDNTDFGAVAATTGTGSRTFTIQNNGAASLTLSGNPKVSLSGVNAADFSVTSQPSSPVAAGSSTTFSILFSPSALGVRTATVSIASNDSSNNPYTFAIQGTGIASVGGEFTTVNRLAVIAPWLLLALAVVAGGTFLVFKRRGGR